MLKRPSLPFCFTCITLSERLWEIEALISSVAFDVRTMYAIRRRFGICVCRQGGSVFVLEFNILLKFGKVCKLQSGVWTWECEPRLLGCFCSGMT
jgi:hypothetical protein